MSLCNIMRWSIDFRCFSLIFLALFSCACLSQDDVYTLYQPDQAPPLKGNQGYLLLNLEVGGTAPSLDFVRLATSERTINHRSKDLKQIGRGVMSLNLQDKPNGFYVLPLTEGLYQVTTIHAPYYDLPFKLDTEYVRTWRFYVEAASVNYAGKLFLDSERKKSSIDVSLINRIATDEQTIREQLEILLSQFPLKSGAGVRDDFYEDLHNEE